MVSMEVSYSCATELSELFTCVQSEHAHHENLLSKCYIQAPVVYS